MKTIRKMLIAYCSMILLAFVITGIAGATTYSITLLENPFNYLSSGYFTMPTSINDSGQVVGFFGEGMFIPNQTHAALWENGKVTDLGGPRGDYINNYADDINNQGQIVGHINNLEDPVATSRNTTLYQNGNIRTLGNYSIQIDPFSAEIFGYKNNAINDNGQVVGTTLTYDDYDPYWGALYYSQATLLKDDNVTYLGALGSHTYKGYTIPNDSFANDINNSGQVAGSAIAADGSLHAVVFENGTITDLNTTAGVTDSAAFAINNIGQVVGVGLSGTNANRAILWENGTVKDLGSLPGTGYSEARDINDMGQIVGRSSIGLITLAMLWQNDTVTDLNTLIDDHSGWLLMGANGINNSGQIIGYGWHSGENSQFSACLLTPNDLSPTPEPATLLLLGFGLLGLAGVSRKKN